jgi:hypothetical protein
MSVVKAKVDTVQDTGLRESQGVVVEASRAYFVTVDNSTEDGPLIFQALNADTVPSPGTSLNDDLPNVKVEERSPQLVQYEQSSDKATFKIGVTYRLQRPEEPEASYTLSGSSSLSQITTQKTRTGEVIDVTYNDDTQRGEIDVFAPEQSIRFGITETTNDPESIVHAWLDHVNAAAWRNLEEKRWLCTGVTYELIDEKSDPKKYNFEYEFTSTVNPDGWVYTVAYKDADGNIPNDVVEGTGIKTIEWHPTKDFTTKFSG